MEKLETYLPDLRASDPARQQHALKALGRLGDRRAIPEIIPFLKSPYPAVRGQAIAALARLPHAWVVAPLLTVLQDERPDLRAQTLRALVRVENWRQSFEHVYDDFRASEAVNRALADPDAKVVRCAIKILSNPYGYRSHEAREALAECAEQPHWAAIPEMRTAALYALGLLIGRSHDWPRQEDTRGVRVLTRALGDADPHAVKTAIEAFVRFSYLAIAWLIDTIQNPSAVTRQAALTALREIYASLGSARSHTMLLFRSDWKEQRFEALIRQSREEERRVATLLADPDASVRNAAARCIGKQGDAEAIPVLVAAIEDAPNGVPEALLELGEKGREALRDMLANRPHTSSVGVLQNRKPDARFVSSLIALLRNDDRNLRMAAACVLGAWKEYRAVEPLIALLPATDGAERDTVLAVLGRLGDRRAIEPLGTLLQQAMPGEAGNVIRTLGLIGGPGVAAPALQALPRLLKQGSAVERNMILRLLAASRDARAFEPLMALTTHPEVVETAVVVEALGILGDRRAVKPLLEMLPRRDLTRAVAEALGRLGDPDAVEPLLEALQATPSYPLEIVVALGRLGDRRAIGPITAAIAQRGKIDFESMEALGGVGAIAVLEEYLQHPDAAIRYHVVKALGVIKSRDEERLAVFQALLKARQDPKEFVRSAATRRLKKMAIRGDAFRTA